MKKKCEVCHKKKSDQRHHRFSNTKPNRKIYGSLLDEEFNLLDVCHDCHVSHLKMPPWSKWNEFEFRIAARENGYKLPRSSKTYMTKNLKANLQLNFEKEIV